LAFLPRMMDVATDIYEDVQKRRLMRTRNPAHAPAAKKAKKSLRQRDPW
jgi:hypothetical protein